MCDFHTFPVKYVHHLYYYREVNIYEYEYIREIHEDKGKVLFIDNINEHFVVILYIMIVMFVVSLFIRKIIYSFI